MTFAEFFVDVGIKTLLGITLILGVLIDIVLPFVGFFIYPCDSKKEKLQIVFSKTMSFKLFPVFFVATLIVVFAEWIIWSNSPSNFKILVFFGEVLFFFILSTASFNREEAILRHIFDLEEGDLL